MGSGIGSMVGCDPKADINKHKHSHGDSTTHKDGHGHGHHRLKSKEKSKKKFKYAVIGRGMIGSSCAKYLAESSSSVLLIGPDEPSSSEYASAEVYGAHYDEGRITKKTDRDSSWAKFAQESIAKYRQIEEKSGQNFYHEVGHLTAGPLAFIKHVRGTGECEHLSEKDIHTRFPRIKLDNIVGAYEEHDAGWISARGFIAAQNKIFKDLGGIIRREIAITCEPHEDGGFIINDSIRADKVVIATGAFTNFKPLVHNIDGGQIQFDLQLLAAQTCLIEVEETFDFPCFTYKDPVLAWCYVLPPIKYPNGKIYMKIGGGFYDYFEFSAFKKKSKAGMSANVASIPETELNDLESVNEWYRSKGDAKHHERLLKLFQSIFPDIKPISSHSDSCVTSHSPSKRPYIGEIGVDGQFVAIAGNGYAGKSADAIGRLAANAALEKCESSDLMFYAPKIRYASTSFI